MKLRFTEFATEVGQCIESGAGIARVISVRTAHERGIYVRRKLRNRIAHHEPIFSRDIHEDHARVNELIAWRCQYTAGWVSSLEAVSAMLPLSP
jgi:hypothetical protein